MGSQYAAGGSLGWFGAVPVVMAVLLWIGVLAGVAAPLGQWLGGNDGQAEAAVQADRGDAKRQAELSCVCAAAPVLQGR